MKKILLTGLLVVASCVNAVEPKELVASLSQEEVEQEQVRVEKLIQRHQIALYVVGAAAVAGVGISFYQLYKTVRPNPTMQDLENAVQAERIKNAVRFQQLMKTDHGMDIPNNVLELADEKNIELIEEAMRKVNDAFNALPWYERMSTRLSNTGKFTWGAIKGTASAMFSLATLKNGGKLFAMGSMQYFANSVRRYFFHPNSLPWYIGYEANYARYCDGIVVAIQEKETLTDDEALIIYTIAQDVMLSLKRVCAFIEYRMNTIEENKQFAAQSCSSIFLTVQTHGRVICHKRWLLVMRKK